MHAVARFDLHGHIGSIAVDGEIEHVELEILCRRRRRRCCLAFLIGEISLGDGKDIPACRHFSGLEPDRLPAEFLHVVHAVRDQDQRAAARQIFLHPAHAFLLERFVADRKHFIGDQQIRFERSDDGETKPHRHSR